MDLVAQQVEVAGPPHADPDWKVIVSCQGGVCRVAYYGRPEIPDAESLIEMLIAAAAINEVARSHSHRTPKHQ